VIYCIQI